jgi:CP family cyanate transporter-like MFS transporter
MTGLYTMALCAGAASAAGLTLPIEKALGGSLHGALAAWALPAAAVAALWLPQVVHGARRTAQDTVHVAGLWRDRLAWNVTLFMGFQSALAYSVFGWLVPILRERGLDALVAGSVVSMSVMIQALSCLAVPHIAVRGKNQSGINLALCAIAVGALLGLLFAPLSTVWLWAALQGVGQGGLIAAAMTVIVLRSRDPQVAAQLSSMAQCVGYLLAASGPLIVGLIRGWSGGFGWCALLFVVLGSIAGFNGWRAGQARYVQSAPSLGTMTSP